MKVQFTEKIKGYFRWHKVVHRLRRENGCSGRRQNEVHPLRQKHQRELHDLRRRQREEFHKQQAHFHADHEQLHRGHEEFHRQHEEFKRLYRSLRFLRPLALILNLVILYLLFRWVGIRAIGIIFAFLIISKEIVQLIFFWRLEKRVFKPIDQLKTGFAEIARGNYDVSIDSGLEDEFLGQLIHSFNNMAAKLQESERVNSEYEENRKTLVANISHDLKTPITSIQGYLEMILEGGVTQPEKIERYLRTIYNNSTYINNLIDDLFLFSKLDLAKMDLNYELLKIRSYMSDLMAEFEFELEDRHYGFSYSDKMQHAYSCNIDSKRVYQAIRNIIGNAVKYGPGQELRVVADLYEEDNFACLDIKDNGPGIPAEKLPYVFNRFYRIDPERSKDLMSTGLGLAIAKELIEAQGGKVSASSPGESGTCFTIKLPIASRAENGVQV